MVASSHAPQIALWRAFFWKVILSQPGIGGSA